MNTRELYFDRLAVDLYREVEGTSIDLRNSSIADTRRRLDATSRFLQRSFETYLAQELAKRESPAVVISYESPVKTVPDYIREGLEKLRGDFE